MEEHFTKKVQSVNSLLKAFDSDIISFTCNKFERSIYIAACFSRTFEMTWKALKGLLQFNSIKEADTWSPKAIIKLAYRESYITEEDLWLDMLDAVNIIEHTYMEDVSDEFVNNIITKYKPELQSTYNMLKLYNDMHL